MNPIRLPEAVEDVGQEHRRDSVPRVSDHDLDRGLELRQADIDATAMRGELYGVGEQVPDDLLEARCASPNNMTH